MFEFIFFVGILGVVTRRRRDEREHKFSVGFPVDPRECLSVVLLRANHHHRFNGISSFEEDTIGGHRTGCCCVELVEWAAANASCSVCRN